MRIKLILAQNVTKEYILPRELGALCSDCWNAGHDGVSMETLNVIEEEGNADE